MLSCAGGGNCAYRPEMGHGANTNQLVFDPCAKKKFGRHSLCSGIGSGPGGAEAMLKGVDQRGVGLASISATKPVRSCQRKWHIRLFTSSLVILCGALLGSAGCSTFATLGGDLRLDKLQCDEGYTIPRVYSGLANDIRFLRGNYQDKGLVVFDAPFSLAADTILLPYTIYRQVRYGNLCPDKEINHTSQGTDTYLNPERPDGRY